MSSFLVVSDPAAAKHILRSSDNPSRPLYDKGLVAEVSRLATAALFGTSLRPAAEHCLHVFVPAKRLLAAIACRHIVQNIASRVAIVVWGLQGLPCVRYRPSVLRMSLMRGLQESSGRRELRRAQPVMGVLRLKAVSETLRCQPLSHGKAVHMSEAEGSCLLPSLQVSQFLFGDGFAVASGDHWRVRRKAVGPSLHRAYLNTMIDRVFGPSAQHLCSKLEVAGRSGESIDMEACFSQLTLDVIGKAVFNYEFNALNTDSPLIQVRGLAVTGVAAVFTLHRCQGNPGLAWVAALETGPK